MIETIESVLAHAKCPIRDMRLVDSILPGQWVRQGDVYLVCVEGRGNAVANAWVPKAQGWKETKNRQLAPGFTTGSRHTVDESVTVLGNPANGGYSTEMISRGRGRLCGPQIVSKDRFTVSHPEHADISLPEGRYQVCYQMDPASQQRVQD